MSPAHKLINGERVLLGKLLKLQREMGARFGRGLKLRTKPASCLEEFVFVF